MKEQDLDIAKQRLIDKSFNLVIVKSGKIIFETKKQGITGFLHAIEELNQDLVKASIADKIVGIAAAKLCIYSRISSVFALTVSEEGLKVLQDNNILCLFEKKVIKILNQSKTDMCPFEKLAMDSGSSEEAYKKLRFFAKKLLNNSTQVN